MTRRQDKLFAGLKLPTKVPAFITAVRALIAAGTKNPALPR